MRKHTYDAVIVGAGLVGSSTALNLSQSGYKVAVIDPNPSSGLGTTSYSAGICRMFYSDMEQGKLAYEGYHHWKNWKKFTNSPNTEHYAEMKLQPGIVLNNKASAEFYGKTKSVLSRLGVDFEEMDKNQTKSLVEKIGWQIDQSYTARQISHDDFGVPNEVSSTTGCLFVKENGFVSDPKLAVENLQKAAEDQGAVFHFKEKVLDIKSVGTGESVDISEKPSEKQSIDSVLTDKSVFSTKIVINCAGPWSPRVNEMTFKSGPNDMNIFTRPLRQEVAYVPAPKNVNYDQNGVIGPDFENGIYLRPEMGNRIVVGSLEPECDELQYITVDDLESGNFNPNLSEDWENFVMRAALRIPELPIPRGKNVQGIVSFYDASCDWKPIYDKSCVDGYYMAIGTSGNQFKNAGVIGKVMGAIIKAEGDHDLNPAKLEMEMSRPGDFLDLSAFSRLRERPVGVGNVFS